MVFDNTPFSYFILVFIEYFIISKRVSNYIVDIVDIADIADISLSIYTVVY